MALDKQTTIPPEKFLSKADAGEGEPHRNERPRDSICDIWGPRTPFHGEGAWPVRVDSHTVAEPDKWVQSACLLCSNGCGLDIGVKDGKMVGVRGRAVDRVNRGRLGPKGLHGWTANESPDRLTQPLIRKDGKLVPATWDEAMELFVKRTKETMKEYTPFSIGVYSTGQIFIEEYYTLALISKAGFQTLHCDGNTRLCTATAAAAMRETFGSDGQPGNFEDFDTTECIFMYGHNMAATQTVTWARILDRLHGPNPPKLIVVDPRDTDSAKAATLHLTPKIGTNMALLNGIQHLLIKKNYVKWQFVKEHTMCWEELIRVVDSYTPEKVEEITGVPAAQIIACADMLGQTNSLVSTCLQGVYQSNQATLSACQVNNINLLLGMIGRPGCGILQMNGQPTAQNNRETGCDGEYPAFRNHLNERHMRELADLWNIEYHKLPHWHVPTHIMKMLNYVQHGSIKMLWVICTNPMVSLPELHRIRKIFSQPDFFLVVQDAFLTETAQFADIVLPTAIWGEKTGTMTNADRTVHISHKAIDPPGQCRSDFDIFLDFARRMDFRDKDGYPLIKWKTPEEAFEAWKLCTKGRIVDYTGLSYAKLSEGSGIQWPCHPEKSPNGTKRLYTDLHFLTDFEETESYGHDPETGTALTAEEYKLLNPRGRAIIKTAHYIPAEEQPDHEYPFRLATGRDVHMFHTRTKTARDKHLRAAAPHAYAQISEQDAAKLELKDGDLAKVSSRRGSIEVPIKVGGIENGQVFVPFHYGWWDTEEDAPLTAANELTITGWDPLSKQPYFKSGAVKIEKVEGIVIHHRERDPESVRAAESRTTRWIEKMKAMLPELRPKHKHIEDCLGELIAFVQELHGVHENLVEAHKNQADVRAELRVFRAKAHEIEQKLQPFSEHLNARVGMKRIRSKAFVVAMFPEHASTAYDLLRDMQSLYTMVSHIMGLLTGLDVTAAALEMPDFREALAVAIRSIKQEQAWALMHAKIPAPQTLIVPV